MKFMDPSTHRKQPPPLASLGAVKDCCYGRAVRGGVHQNFEADGVLSSRVRVVIAGTEAGAVVVPGYCPGRMVGADDVGARKWSNSPATLTTIYQTSKLLVNLGHFLQGCVVTSRTASARSLPRQRSRSPRLAGLSKFAPLLKVCLEARYKYETGFLPVQFDGHRHCWTAQP